MSLFTQNAQLFGLVISIVAMTIGIVSVYLSRRQLVDFRRRLEDTIEASVGSLNASLLDDVSRGIFDNLKRNTRLSSRLTTIRVNEKKHLAMALADPEGVLTSGDRLARESLIELIVRRTVEQAAKSQQHRSIFIESGSTLAYLGKALADSKYVDEATKPVKFTTNNVLVDQTLVFKRNATVNLLEGTPLGRYGATFGESTPDTEPDEIIAEWREEDSPKPIQDQIGRHNTQDFYIGAQSQYKTMSEDIRSFLDRYGVPTFCLMTTSSLSLEDGPHVGSFQNRDFKENMYHYAAENGIPFLMLLYDGKIHEEPRNREICLSVFGEDAKGHINGASKPRPDGKPISGFEAFSFAIAKGEIYLVVTNVTAPPSGIASDKESRAASFYRELRSLSWIQSSGHGIDIYESPHRTVRIFAARLEGVSDKTGSIIRFIKDLRDPRFGFSRTSVWATE